MILILSDKFDVHADLVCKELDDKNVSYARLNLDTESLYKTAISWTRYGFEIIKDSRSVNSKDIKCVWVRRAFVELNLSEANSSDPKTKIWKGEWDRCLIGLYQYLSDVPWLNKLDKSYRADNKFLQNILAREIGFNLPETITTNDKENLLNFARAHDSVVIKMLNQGFYLDADGKNKGMYVNKITELDLNDFGESGENPITLQQYISKSFEVRYTVVGADHHVCKIESQKSSRAKIDWRRYDLANTPHSLISPPKKIKEMVIILMKRLQLEYGALDFIVSPSGKWFFLEINSMGQWLWIENLTGTKISKSISQWLIKTMEDSKKQINV